MSKAITCWFGDNFEVMNAGKSVKEVRWTPFWYGMLTGVLPWGIMIGELLRSPNLDKIPSFVWFFVVEYFICFFAFPITMYR